MADNSFLQSSTRRNSLTSLSTANSYNTVSTTARSMSTEHLTNLDDKFMKKSIKKLPTSMIALADKFHKTNTGTYYFPNGEIFRPRMTPSKRHRPGKVPGSSRNNSMTKDSTAGYVLHYTPSTGTPEIPRSSSMVSMQSANSSSSPIPNAYVSKSSSFTNLRRSNKQNLAQSLRSNKIDTPTNINIQNLAPVHGQAPTPSHAASPTISNSLSPSVPNAKNFQPNNVLRESECIPGAFKISDNIYTDGQPNHPQATNINQNRPVPASSDSNLSSLSNYNLNRSSSNTPQTSINTSIDIEEAPEGYVKSIKNENKNIADDELQKTSSLESIKETELHSIEEVPKIDVQNDDISVDARPEPDHQNGSFEGMEETAKESTTVHPLNKGPESTLQEHYNAMANNNVAQYPDEDINHFEESTLESTQGPKQTLMPMRDEMVSQESSRDVLPEPDRDVVEEFCQPTQSRESISQLQDLEQGSEESDIIAEYSAESESDSESEILNKIPKPTLGMIEANDSSDFSQEDMNCTQTQIDSDTEDLSTLHDISEDKTRCGSPVKHTLVFERSNSDDFQTPEGSPVPHNSEFFNNEEQAKNVEEELNNMNNENFSHTREQIVEADKQSHNIQDIEKSKPFPVSQSVSPDSESPKPKNFFDFHKDDAFDKFLNDNQAEVPPRGDVAVVGDKIRKHERSVSSISSFNSILHSEFESPSKSNGLFSKSPRQMSPRIPHSHSNSIERTFNADIKNSGVEEKALPITPTEGRFPVEKSLPASPKDNIVSPDHYSPNLESPQVIVPEGGSSTAQVSDAGALKAPTSNSMLLDSAMDMNSEVKPNKQPVKKGSMLDVVSADSNALKKKPPSNLQDKASDKASLGPANKLPKVNSLRNLNGDPKLKKSSSTANFKAFFKKLFPMPSTSSSSSTSFESKSSKNPKRSQTDILPESSFNKPKKLNKSKRSFSFANLKLAGFNNKSDGPANEPNPTTEPQENQKEARPILGVLENEIITQTENLTITKLPTIERDDSLFEDMFTNFDEKFNRANSTKSKVPTNSINELFIKDDELTRDQIEDQQKRDNNQISDDIDEEETKSTSSEAFSMANSDDIYIDDNIRYLQDELIWPIDNDEFTSIEDYSVLSRSGTVKTKLNPEVNDEQGESTVETIVVDNEQLTDLFDNLSELQKRRLPIHLKHISQFKDSKILEISIRKFESIPDLSNLRIENGQLNSILKKQLGTSENKKVQFSNKISINETFSPDMYKRYNKSVTQYTLTEAMEINKIKNELNTYKCNEMLVHEHSQNNTHFFY
mmetsp:Transcript_5461/g.6363  ORF Transcript_5461/g.6363 Transcript_5461/m.6363 type:complete len:1291 (+) Transcript_5461:373-4245(+)